MVYFTFYNDLSDGAEVKVNNKNINLKTITHITKQDPINFIPHDDKDPPVTITPGGGLVTDLVRKFEGWGPRRKLFRFGDNSMESPNKRQRRSSTPSSSPGTSSGSTCPPGSDRCPGTPPTAPRTLPCTPSHRRHQARQGSRPGRTLTRRPETPSSLRRSCSDSPINLTTSAVRVTHPSLTVFGDGGHPLELLHQHQGRLHLPFEGPGSNHQHHNIPGVREIIRKIDNNIKSKSNDNKKEEELKARNTVRNIAAEEKDEDNEEEEKKRISISIQKKNFSRIDSKEDQEAYLQVPGPGAEASSSTRSPASSSCTKSLEILTSMKSVTSVVTRKSFTVPESSGAGPGKSYSNLILNGIISEHFVIDACSCSTAATQCANCSSAVLAGNQNLNF